MHCMDRYRCPKCGSKNVRVFAKKLVSQTVEYINEGSFIQESLVDEDEIRTDEPHEFACGDCEYTTGQEIDWLDSYPEDQDGQKREEKQNG